MRADLLTAGPGLTPPGLASRLKRPGRDRLASAGTESAGLCLAGPGPAEPGRGRFGLAGSDRNKLGNARLARPGLAQLGQVGAGSAELGWARLRSTGIGSAGT